MKDVSHSMRLLVLLITIDGIAEGFKENHQEKICITYKAYIYMYIKLMQSVTMGWHMISISATNPHQELHQPWNINAACLFFNFFDTLRENFHEFHFDNINMNIFHTET